MTELSTLLMKNIDLILEAYTVDAKGALIVGNKKKVAEADEVFHEYFVKSMNSMFRKINENDPIMHQPDGMGMPMHGHDDLGIGHDMMGDMAPMGHQQQQGHPQMMGDENDMTGMYPHQMAMAGHEMHGHEMGNEMGGHEMGGHDMHGMPHMEGADNAEYDWLFNEEVGDADINEMFDIQEDEQELNEFGDHDQFGMGDQMGDQMDAEGGHNDFGGDMGGMAGGDDGMGLGQDDGMDGGGMMGGGDGMMGGDAEMITIHGETDNGSPFEFSFNPNTLGFGDGDEGDGGFGGDEGGEHHGGHEEHGEHGGHEDFGHMGGEPGMGDDEEQEPPVAEAAAFHNGKPRRSKGPKSSRMAVVPADPKTSSAAPFPTPQGSRQKR